MKKAFLFALVMGLGLSAASAQDKPKRGAKDDSAKADKSFDFSGDQIDGDMIRPEGSIVDTRAFAQRTSLIRMRTDFIREILKSAEDL